MINFSLILKSLLTKVLVYRMNMSTCVIRVNHSIGQWNIGTLDLLENMIKIELMNVQMRNMMNITKLEMELATNHITMLDLH